MKPGLCCYFSGYILKDSDYFLLFIYFLFLSALATKSSSVQPSGSSQNCPGRGGLLCSKPSTSRVGQTSSQRQALWRSLPLGLFCPQTSGFSGKTHYYMWKKKEPTCTVDGNVNWCVHCREHYGSFSKKQN